MAKFWLHSGCILATFWLNFGYILGTFWIHFGYILATFWLHFGYILATFRLHSCYILVVHDENCPHNVISQEEGVQVEINRTMCAECGGLVCYADDSTYTVTGKNEVELSEKLTEKFKSMAEYLSENRLCINTDKTHTMVLCTEQKRRHIETKEVMLDTGSEIIHPTPSELLLGFQVDQNLGFPVGWKGLCAQ